MKGIAKDICTKCKHCEGLDMFTKMYSCKHYNNYPDSAIGMDCEIECDNYEVEGYANDKCPRCKYCLGMTPMGMYSCGYANDGSTLNIGVDVVLSCANFKEVNMKKVEGKVVEFCPKCKNCKGVTRESNGVHVWLTEVECEDPYDGMTKTLDADSDICCSMFEPKPVCEKCERFDGTYCHTPEGIFVTSYMSMFGDYTTGNCPWYSEKKEKEPFHLNMPREAIKTIAKLNDIICELEKEKAAHLKGIERLKKSQEKLQNQVKNLQTTNEESYKREEKLEDKVHKLERRLLEDIKLLNKSEEKCISRGNDIDHLLSENKELKGRVKYWSDIATNSAGQIIKFKQTISDQEITIKALLITIKEMCKEDETNA